MAFLNFIIPSSSPLINYKGQWQQNGPPINGTCASNYSQGTPSFTTNDSGATATLVFVGTPNITIYGGNGPDNGNYSVKLDNEPLFTGRANGHDNTTSPFPLWNTQNLSNSQHNVVITLQKGEFDLDCISIGREIGPSGYTGPIFSVTLDDESPFITYNGSWSSSFSATAFNQSIHSTTKGGSSASLQFQGSSVELYGNGASFQVQVDDQLPMTITGSQIDNNGGFNNGHPGQGPSGHGPPGHGPGGPPGSSGDSDSQPPSTLLFYMDGLDENKTHVVTLTNPQQSFMPLDLDFATVRGSKSFFNDTPSPNPNFTDTMSKPAHSRIPVGAIVGGVVGGVVGLIVLGFIAFIFVRRSCRSRHNYNTSTRESLRNARSGLPFGETPVGEPFMSFVTDTAYDHNSSASQFDHTFPGRLPVQHIDPFPVPTAI